MSNNLFIIGNGFDRGHSIQSSYWQFKQWLMKEYQIENDEDYIFLAEGTFMPDGEMAYSDKDYAKFLVNCISSCTNGNWSEFEKNLGKIDWDLYFDHIEVCLDEDGDIDLWKMSHINEVHTSLIMDNSKAVNKLFSCWIHSLQMPQINTATTFLSNMPKDSLFLTFNYTNTLQVVYGIKDDCIYHIHGNKNSDIIIGHGNDKSHLNDDCECDIGKEDISTIHDSFIKPVYNILNSEKSKDFFAKIKAHNITDIYSWGFSYGKVDLPYIKHICNILNTSEITWHFNDFDNEWKTSGFDKTIRKCGFKGKISSFTA